MAAIEALKTLKETCSIDLTNDFQYVRKGVTEWIVNWKKNGWKTSAKKPVKNADLWQLLDAEAVKHKINWHWVKGHAGHRENEIADDLANQGIPN